MKLPPDAKPFDEEIAQRIASIIPDGAAAKTLKVLRQIRATGAYVCLMHSEKQKGFFVVDYSSETVQ